MKLSIIIPTYNEEECLLRLLESIKKQDFKDYEIIVADANSKDKTKKIAKENGCILIEGGLPAKGRNNGAKIAKGECLFFLDADAILTKNYLKEALNEFIEEDLGIAITQVIPLSDRNLDKFLHNFANFFMKSVEHIKPHGAACCGILTKKILHEKINGFDESMDFGEDTDYIERVSKISNFKVLRNPKLFISVRRLDKEGRKNISLKYAKSTFCQFVGKNVTASQLGYNFGYSKNKRILYAVCGEGMGHAIRSVVIIKHLLKKHDVMIVASGRAYDYLAKKFDNVFNISGFNIIYENNRVNSKKTFFNAVRKLSKNLKQNIKILYRLIRYFKPNIIITDFEFFSNIIAKLMAVPIISIDNQHVMTKCRIKVPRKYMRERMMAISVIRTFIVRPKKYIVTTFFYPPVKNMKRISLFPPVLREEIFKLKPTTGKHVFVYQTSDSYGKLIPLLNQINEKFVVYGHHKEGREGNIEFSRFNEGKFLKEFASAKAVITNGGFTLIGEALHLGKPVLSIPVKKQFEQILNAIYLQRLGYGEFHEDLNEDVIEGFLSRLGIYCKNLESYKKEDNSRILNEIEHLVERYSKRYYKSAQRNKQDNSKK
jgi:uncharacterized protein (TIGR00661 family)